MTNVKDVKKSESSYVTGVYLNVATALENSLAVLQIVKQNYHMTQQLHT